MLKPAEQLFKATKRLDPDLPHVGRNLDELARRRRKKIDVTQALPPQVKLALPQLARRVETIAGKAQPAEGMRISLAMIVKDEEEMLPRCLEAIHDVVDEMVIVDTGSTDATVEIAESFGAKVLHHEWTGDWFIYLDADEVLVREDAERLRELAGHVWREAFFLVETNFTGDLDDGMAVNHNTLRMFRNRPEYRFKDRIHEQIAHSLPANMPERLEQPSVRIEHYGYLGAVRDSKEKSRRNIELLERQVAEGESSPFLCFNLGSEYAAAGDAPKALKMGDAPSRYSPMVGCGSYIALGVLADIRRDQGDFAECERLLMESLREHPGFLGAVHPLASIMLAQDQEPELVEETIESVVEALTPSAHFMLGSALYEHRNAEAAEVQFRAVLDKQPSSDSARVALSETLLSQSRWEEAAQAAAGVDDLSAYAAPARR